MNTDRFVSPEGDIRLHFGISPVRSTRDAKASCDIAARRDFRRFKKQLHRDSRVTLASKRECEAAGQKIGSRVFVMRGLRGSQIRAFLQKES